MMMAAREDNWGPWAETIGEAERLARLRSLRTVIDCAYGTDHPLIRALYFAESLEPAELQEALLELGRMPARDQRKVLSVYGRILGYKAQRDAARATKKEDDA